MGANNSVLCGCFQDMTTQKKKNQILEPFFQGQTLSGRLQYLRQKYIEPIRQNFNKELFEKNIKELQNNLKFNPEWERRIKRIKYRYWYDKIEEQKFDKKSNKIIFGFLQAYTNQYFYRSIIASKLNNILRIESLPEPNVLQMAIFILQAINIQLYLATKRFPELHNFQGVVFRGFSCLPGDYEKYKEIFQKPLESRIISVPLSLWSSSKRLQVAQEFLKKDDTLINIILEIHVIQMEKEDLLHYNSRFPESIISTICAVDITIFSEHEKEAQVLLRGAFCLVLDQEQRIQKINSKGVLINYNKIICVMVNGNRDHISTNHLGQKTIPSRDMFGLIASKARLNYAMKYKLERNQNLPERKYFEEKKMMAEEIILSRFGKIGKQRDVQMDLEQKISMREQFK